MGLQCGLALCTPLTSDVIDVKQAKLQLAQTQPCSVAPVATDDEVESLMGADLFVSAGVLGRPSLDDLLTHQKGWHRIPEQGEALVVNEDTHRLHALRPPLLGFSEEALPAHLETLRRAQAKTWCGWVISVKSKRQHAQSLALWSPALSVPHTLQTSGLGN